MHQILIQHHQRIKIRPPFDPEESQWQILMDRIKEFFGHVEGK